MSGISATERDAFRRAWLEPSEQGRVRFAVFLRSMQKLRQLCAPNASLLLAKAVLRNGFRSVQGHKAHADPPGGSPRALPNAADWNAA
ncbi:hypothetical protein CSV79_05065 [Sporosarcina sp. P13]|nr:hypothetical protein CSV79_05065 [Sporosarcina sp. P13]